MIANRAGFELFLQQSGRKKSTIYRLIKAFDRLEREAPTLGQEELETFFLKLLKEGKRHSYLNSFINFLRVYNQYQPIPYIPKEFKDQAVVKSTMSDKEIEEFLNLPCPTCKVRTKSGWTTRRTDSKGWNMWTMFFTIMAYTGMRTGEVAQLAVNDIDFGRQVFMLKDTKTNTPRMVPLPPSIQAVLRQYTSDCQTRQLFPTRRNSKSKVVKNSDWHYNFHKRINIMGIKRQGLTPYSLRHSFITRMLEEDVNIFKVQKIVGHKQLSTTAGYTHLTTKDIIKTIKRDRLTLQSSPAQVIKLIREFVEDLELDTSQYSFSFTENDVHVTLK